jgi:hypothetical protein
MRAPKILTLDTMSLAPFRARALGGILVIGLRYSLPPKLLSLTLTTTTLLGLALPSGTRLRLREGIVCFVVVVVV